MKKIILAVLILTGLITGIRLIIRQSNSSLNSSYSSLSSSYQSPTGQKSAPLTNAFKPNINFTGAKGKEIILANNEVKLDIFNDNQARFFNVEMLDGKIIYFFVVRDKNGIYRAAANACAVCFKTYKGFHQEGDEIVCNNCGNRYPIEKIATEKGGCNPGPINPNLEIKNGRIIIKQADLEQVLDLF